MAPAAATPAISVRAGINTVVAAIGGLYIYCDCAYMDLLIASAKIQDFLYRVR